MRKPKIITVFIILIIVGVIISICVTNEKEPQIDTIKEITPEEEISEEQERKTIISLFFKDKETQELTQEARSIDAKLLSGNPYEEIMKLLIEGPKVGNLEKTIPDGTKINSIIIKGSIVYLDLSREFIDNHEGGLDKESQTIYSIVNTLTELNEVSSVKILIDGQENLEFKDGCINFKGNFERND